jgi:hypothetical protein
LRQAAPDKQRQGKKPLQKLKSSAVLQIRLVGKIYHDMVEIRTKIINAGNASVALDHNIGWSCLVMQRVAAGCRRTRHTEQDNCHCQGIFCLKKMHARPAKKEETEISVSASAGATLSAQLRLPRTRGDNNTLQSKRKCAGWSTVGPQPRKADIQLQSPTTHGVKGWSPKVKRA